MSPHEYRILRGAFFAVALMLAVSFSVFGQQSESTEAAAKPPASAPAMNKAAAVDKNAADKPEASKADASTKAAGIPELDKDYHIGVQDGLTISVWHEPELSLAVVVRPDGMITLPLVNDVNVVGLTTEDLAKLLTDKFKPYVAEPQVTVIVTSIHSRVVYLAGQVGRVGEMPLNSRKTVLQALLEAGGPGAFAKTESIYVLRKKDGVTERLPFKYKRALKGDKNADFELVPGDIIVVP